MQTLLPLRQLLKEIYHKTFVSFNELTLADQSHTKTNLFDTKRNTKIKPSEVFEDNAGCIVLATTEGHRPRTKHLAAKWHHFL